MDRLTLTEIFNDQSVTATALHVAVLEVFGTVIYEWDPLTLWLEIRDELRLELPEANQDKLQALLAAVGTDGFYKTTQGFYTIANTLTDGDGGFQVFDPISVAEMLWAIYEVAINRDPEPFSPSVDAMIRNILSQEGNSGAPEAYLQSLGDSEASDNPISELDRFLKDRQAKLREDLFKINTAMPALPDLDSVLDPVLSQNVS